MTDMIKVQYVGIKSHSVMYGGEEYIFELNEVKEVPGFVGRYLLSKFPESVDSANLKGCLFKKAK